MSGPLPIFSVGTRVAGVVIVAGYLLGLVPGLVVSLVGGLALITYGRALLVDDGSASLSVAALAVTAGALGVGALRWGTLDLGELRGAQAVLGPTVLVGPPELSGASIAAGVAALIALGVWWTAPRPSGRIWVYWSALEGALWALAVVTVFFDPATAAWSGLGAGTAVLEAVRWAVAIAAAAAIGYGISWLQRRLGPRLRVIPVGIAGLAVAGAVGVVVLAG